MSEIVGKKMMMIHTQPWYYASADCIFLFKQWKTTSEEPFSFILGLVACFLFAFLADLLPGYSKHWQESKSSQQSPRLSPLIAQTLNYFSLLSQALLMFLMMSYNIWVILAIVAGKTLHYGLYTVQREEETEEGEGCK